MKKLGLIALFVILGISLNAQEVNFGVKAGVDIASVRLEADGANVSTSETGFYFGGFAEVAVSESLNFRPEVLYVSVDELDFVAVPLLASFPVSEQFDILVGPSLGFLFDTAEDEKSFNFGIDAGASYDITEQFFVEARYSLGLANLLEDAPSGFALKLSGFFAGIGYKF